MTSAEDPAGPAGRPIVIHRERADVARAEDSRGVADGRTLGRAEQGPTPALAGYVSIWAFWSFPEKST